MNLHVLVRGGGFTDTRDGQHFSRSFARRARNRAGAGIYNSWWARDALISSPRPGIELTGTESGSRARESRCASVTRNYHLNGSFSSLAAHACAYHASRMGLGEGLSLPLPTAFLWGPLLLAACREPSGRLRTDRKASISKSQRARERTARKHPPRLGIARKERYSRAIRRCNFPEKGALSRDDTMR